MGPLKTWRRSKNRFLFEEHYGINIVLWILGKVTLIKRKLHIMYKTIAIRKALKKWNNVIRYFLTSFPIHCRNHNNKVFYISNFMSWKKRMYNSFPWTKPKEMKKKIDSSLLASCVKFFSLSSHLVISFCSLNYPLFLNLVRQWKDVCSAN